VKTAVIAMAYGSPTRIEDVPAYLQDVRGGRPPRAEMVASLVERYKRIGGASPLNEVTEKQRAALEAELGLPVYVGMKHWEPWIGDAVRRAIDDGAERLVGLVLAPHYSSISVGAYRERMTNGIDGSPVEIAFIASWHDHEPFIRVLADRVRGTRAHVVFTAHSLPARILAENDPYRDQLLETSRLVASRAGLDSSRWSFAFQSESPTGEPWLGPDILDELTRLKGEGVRSVLVFPIGFVADHLEVLWDLDIEAREHAEKLGLELERVPSLNDDPEFVRALASLVRKEIGS
jgi:protoporphyrin/coproporphyrin ferrochelatase